jgi:hypothetical protein
LSMLLLSGVELTVAESQLPWYISGSELCLWKTLVRQTSDNGMVLFFCQVRRWQDCTLCKWNAFASKSSKSYTEFGQAVSTRFCLGFGAIKLKLPLSDSQPASLLKLLLRNERVGSLILGINEE